MQKIKDIIENLYYSIYRTIYNIRNIIKSCYQLFTQGYRDTEAWNLYYYIAKFILPRLKHLRKYHYGYHPDMTNKQWEKVLDKIIYSMESILEDKVGKKTQEGCELLGKYFTHLWD